jgi:hypothetical protein
MCRHNIKYVSKAPNGELTEILKQEFGTGYIKKNKGLFFERDLTLLKISQLADLSFDLNICENSS